MKNDALKRASKACVMTLALAAITTAPSALADGGPRYYGWTTYTCWGTAVVQGDDLAYFSSAIKSYLDTQDLNGGCQAMP